MTVTDDNGDAEAPLTESAPGSPGARAALEPPPKRPRRVRRQDDAAVLGKTGAVTFVAPAFALIALFLMFPAVWTLYLGLTNFRLTGTAAAEPQFVGLDNVTEAVSDPLFRNSLWITLIFVAASGIVGQMGFGFTLAWLFRKWRPVVRRTVEVLVIVAWIVPGSVVAFLWLAFLDGQSGTLNAILPGDITTEWLLRQPLLAIIVFNIWRGSAFAMLLFDAALTSIPPSHLETAQLAGASGWQTLRDVVIPTMKGHVVTTLLLVSMWTFNLFTPFLLTGGGPNFQTEVLAIYVYRTAIRQGRLGYGAAISAVMLIINLIIALVYLRVLRERRDR